MDLNQRARRPVGRAAMLQQMLENSSNSSARSDESCANISTSNLNGSFASSLDTSKISSDSGYRSKGRGQLYDRMLHANDSIATNTLCSNATPIFGMGRGRMTMLNQINNENEKKAEETVQSVDEGIEDLSLGSTEDEPVIKRGTKG